MLSQRRLIDRLESYWEKLKGGDELPKIQKVTGNALDDIWQSCFILEIHSSGKSAMYKFDFFGADITKAYGKDMSKQYVSPNIMSLPGAKVLEKVKESIKNKIPYSEDGTFVNVENKTVKFRSCILPFSRKNDGRVSHILVGLSWRKF